MVDFAGNAPHGHLRGARLGVRADRERVRMRASFGDLEPRRLERLRTELAEALSAHVAYPSFFDYRAGRARTRPVDRVKRDEIEQYLRSVNFEPLNAVDLSSPEVRRFIERLMLRYIEVNPAVAQPWLARRLSELRSRVPRMAAEVHRGLLAFLNGEPTAASFGIRRQQPSWAESAAAAVPSRAPAQPRPASERNTRVLEAILVRQELGDGAVPAAPSAPLPPPPASAPAASAPPPTPTPTPRRPPASPAPGPVVEPAPAWLLGSTGPVGSGDLTVPVPAQGWPSSPGQSPFAGLESGAQSAVFGPISTVDDVRAITDRPTGPLPAVSGRGGASGASPIEISPRTPRELPPDLYQLYGDYLRDMEPEAEPPPSSAPLVTPSPRASTPGVNGARSYPATPAPAPVHTPAHAPVHIPPPPSALRTPVDEGARSDKLIFWQLRYQLEAYVRRAAQSYGVRGASDDPSSILDALRRSTFVDEADLRIAEGILALTDRVTATGAATVEDYRQAFLLYLLYHRSHLGV